MTPLPDSSRRRLPTLPTGSKIIVAFLAGVLALGVDFLFPEPRLAFEDLLLDLLPGRPLDSRIVLVDLEDWPRPRDELARIVTTISAMSPAVIGLDVILDHTSVPARDDLLFNAIARAGNVVLPVGCRRGKRGWKVDSLLPAASRPAAAIGFANFKRDSDGVVRSIPGNSFFDRSSDWPFPGYRQSFAFAVAATFLNDPAQRSILPQQGEAHRIDWAHTTVARMPVASADKLLGNPRYRAGLQELKFMDDRIVLVGLVGQEPYADLFTTPLSPARARIEPGLLIHANALSNLLRGEELNEIDTGPWFATILLVAALGVILGSRGVGKTALIGVSSLALLLMLVELLLLDRSRLVFPALPAIFGLGFGSLSAMLLVSSRLIELALFRPLVALLQISQPPSIAFLNILSERDSRKVRFRFQLRRGPNPGDDISTCNQEASLEEYHNLTERLETSLRQGKGYPPEVEIQELGLDTRIFAMGGELARALARLKSTHLHLELTEPDLSIPWELATIDDRPLSTRFCVSRSLVREEWTEPVAPALPREGELQALLIGNPLPLPASWEPLPDTEEEVAELASYLERLGHARDVPIRVERLEGTSATLDAVLDRLSAGNLDILHYSGHLAHMGVTRSKSGLILGGGTLSIESFKKLPAGTPLPSMMFLNACGSARSSMDAPEGQGQLSFPSLFLARGVKLYVGTLWSVETGPARRFSQTFYQQLLQGRGAGEALRSARSTRSRNWLTDAAYIMYGDPRYRLASRPGGITTLEV